MNKAIWTVLAFSGAAALIAMFLMAEKSESGLLFGFSLARLSIFGLTAAGVIAIAVCAAAVWLQPAWWRRLSMAAGRFCNSQARLFGLMLALFTVFTSLAAFLLLALSQASRELVMLNTLLERVSWLLAWVELALALFSGLLLINLRSSPSTPAIFTPLRLSIFFAVATAVYFAALKIYAAATWDARFLRLEQYIFLPALVFLIWAALVKLYSSRTWYERASRVMLLLSIGAVAYTIFRHTTQWIDWQVTPSKAYWHLLADAFLKGRLYLIDPPTTHDLTFFNGNWYVPNPPLPGLMLIPLVAMSGAEGINTTTFSLLLGTATVVLVYLILERASRLELIPTGRAANLWITAVFAFGTCYWWLSVTSRMWFMSQQVTLLFAALALFAVLYKWSPWLIGLGLGLAVLSRPNVFTLWPFLLGLFVYFDQRESGVIRWKRILPWSIQSALPVVLAAGGLLFYNYIRFSDWVDFGYVGITSADWLTSAVRTYGMFNAHFLGANLHAMFLKLPVITWQNGCLTYSPTHEGFSLFAMTPALFYLFRRFKWNLWTAGAWSSVLLTAGLLLFYHNIGAWQMGYRYLMDFILPVLLLLAIAIGKKPSWIFIGLALLSMVVNFLGIVWWFDRWWC